MTAGGCELRPVEGEGRVGEDKPGSDDVTNDMLMTAGSCKLGNVEGEGRVGEDKPGTDDVTNAMLMTVAAVSCSLLKERERSERTYLVLMKPLLLC